MVLVLLDWSFWQQELCIIYFSILSPAQCLAHSRGLRNEWMNEQANVLFFTLCDIYSKFTNKPRDIFFKPSKNCLGICDFLSLWGSPLLFDNCGRGGRWRKIGKKTKEIKSGGIFIVHRWSNWSFSISEHMHGLWIVGYMADGREPQLGCELHCGAGQKP